MKYFSVIPNVETKFNSFTTEVMQTNGLVSYDRELRHERVKELL